MQARRIGDIMSQLALSGSALVNQLPFRTLSPLLSSNISRLYSVQRLPLFKYKPLASECRELGREMKNERLDFVRISMAWNGPRSGILSPLTDRKRDGTEVPSRASEHLQGAASAGALHRGAAERP